MSEPNIVVSEDQRIISSCKAVMLTVVGEDKRAVVIPLGTEVEIITRFDCFFGKIMGLIPARDDSETDGLLVEREDGEWKRISTSNICEIVHYPKEDD